MQGCRACPSPPSSMSTPEASALGKGPPEQAAPTPQGTLAASLPMPPCKVPPNLLPSQQPLCLVATAVGSTKVAPAQQLPKTSIGGLRLAAPCPVVAKAPQATTLNLPVNIQLPQGKGQFQGFGFLGTFAQSLAVFLRVPQQ